MISPQLYISGTTGQLEGFFEANGHLWFRFDNDDVDSTKVNSVATPPR
jgi:hypothetical protein